MTEKTEVRITKREIIQGLVHLEYPSLYELTRTFLRPQEFYESPEFKGRVFTLQEFKSWYIKNSDNGKKTGRFTYYTDWAGFNLPSTAFVPFWLGQFNPLSQREKNLLRLLEDEKNSRFYVISSSRRADHSRFVHEVAHGLFYLNPLYRQQALEVVKNMKNKDLATLTKKLKELGYDSSVFDDETQAYLVKWAHSHQIPRIGLTPQVKSDAKKMQDILKVTLGSDYRKL